MRIIAESRWPSKRPRRPDHVLHFRTQHRHIPRRMPPEAARRRYPQAFLADNARPVGDPLADLLDRLDPVAALVDDTGCKLHVSRHALERLPLDPLEKIFEFERRDINDAVEPLEDINPGRGVE